MLCQDHVSFSLINRIDGWIDKFSNQNRLFSIEVLRMFAVDIGRLGDCFSSFNHMGSAEDFFTTRDLERRVYLKVS